MFEQYIKNNERESLIPVLIFMALILLFFPGIGAFILADVWDDLHLSQSSFREYEIEYDRIAVETVGLRSNSHYMVLSKGRSRYSIAEKVFKDEISTGELESLLRMSSKAKVWVKRDTNNIYGLETTGYVIPLEKGMNYLRSNARIGLYFSFGFFFVGAIPIVLLIVGAILTSLEILAAKMKRLTSK